MLDVHPPHASTHTWRDFFLHIATIVIGLLIAVGLEQTVEAIHHHDQREALIANFRGECKRNIQWSARMLATLQSDRVWQQAWLDSVRKSSLDPRVVTVVLPAKPETNDLEIPARSVWVIAKSNGTAALLPENVAEVYDRTDHESDEFYRKADTYNETLRRIGNRARADGFSVNPRSATPPISVSLSSPQRAELAAALADAIGDDNALIRWTAIVGGASQAVLDNVGSRDAMSPYIVHVVE